ncbi:hypothetical protein D3C74_332370 [compost metagenome]
MEQHFGNGDACCADPVHHDFDILDIFAADLQGVQQPGKHHDGRSVLVVMEYRNVQLIPESLFNLKTPRRGNIFEINASECRGERFYNSNNLFRTFRVEADGHSIHIGELFEQRRFAFHHRHGRSWADISQTQYSSSIRYHSHCVFLCCQFIGLRLILCDRLTDLRHTRCIYLGQVFFGPDRIF